MLFHFSRKHLEPDNPGPTDLHVQINHILLASYLGALTPHLLDFLALNHRNACLFSAFPSPIISKIPIEITHLTRLFSRLFLSPSQGSLPIDRTATYSSVNPLFQGPLSSPSFCLTDCYFSIFLMLPSLPQLLILECLHFILSRTLLHLQILRISFLDPWKMFPDPHDQLFQRDFPHQIC